MGQPQTLLSTLKQAMQQLKDVGIPTAELDARVLLEHAIQQNKTFCVLNPSYILTSQEQTDFQGLIEQRLTRKPVAKILGYKEFWSLSFKTTEDTLDPRPDSETLIEAVLDAYKDTDAPLRILDLGTGTGCLLLTLLSEYKKATGVGADLSPKALAVATENATSLGLGARAAFIESNWTENLDGAFDIVISNPPYIPQDQASTLEPELSFDPEGALYGGNDDGLGAYHLIAQQITPHLNPHAKLFLEFGKNQHDQVQRIFEAQDFNLLNLHKDLTSTIRCASLSKKSIFIVIN